MEKGGKKEEKRKKERENLLKNSTYGTHLKFAMWKRIQPNILGEGGKKSNLSKNILPCRRHGYEC